ncbi:hypothetical protein [Rhodomicrobium lacus]|uniref:hypothetical protein n=1 Tax=Rhodomicrobium lacus TaxID=2498452 RepID=UPI0026E1DECF|nr:hypothetical protein [Rhodomicrobium lacus]WKW51893.1 hypothetical protein QMO75_05280 [Rhodomicrobium lacus]
MTEAVRRITQGELEAASRALISARETNLGYEISMPVVYPTGQCVAVVVTVAGGDYIVHDAGFGSMYLTAAGVSLTAKLNKKLASVAEMYGCEFISGRMSMTCTEKELAVAIALVANASKAVGDQLVEVRRKQIRDFKREVSAVLTDVAGASRVKTGAEIVGDSGTTYEVNFVLLDKALREPLAYVEPVSDRDAVNGKFREFSDIAANANYSKIDRISVYDDRHEWRSGDIIILRRVSNTVPFNDLSTRLERLSA